MAQGNRTSGPTRGELTEHEGMLLALLAREEPATAYQLYRIVEQSPVTSINSSKGTVYPAVRRLLKRNLLAATKVEGDARSSERLKLTPAGRQAVRDWVKQIDLAHVVLDDPLRTRMGSLGMLSREERFEWVSRAKALVKAKRDHIDEYDRSISMPYQDIAFRSVALALQAEMDWLDALLYQIGTEA